MTNNQKRLFIQLVGEIAGDRVEHNEDVQSGIILSIQYMAFQHRQEIAKLLADTMTKGVENET